MKDTQIVFMTTWRCRNAQYRVDKAFSRILGRGEHMEKRERGELKE
jgi:hypothetical protein